MVYINPIEEFIKRELAFMMHHHYYLQEMMKAHEMIFGVSVGPTLSMIDPTKIGYGGWTRR